MVEDVARRLGASFMDGIREERVARAAPHVLAHEEAQATAAEQKLVIAMALLGDGDVKRKEVAAAMGVTSTAISMARQSLMDKGLIEATTHGRMRFTAPGLAEYIRNYVDDE